MKLREAQVLEMKAPGNITTFLIDLDVDVKIEHIKPILEVLNQYPVKHLNSLVISEAFSYTLQFKSCDDLLAYIKTHALEDADNFAIHSGYSADLLNFGFRLRTNHILVSFRRHESEEVLRIVTAIEQALLPV